MKAVPREAEETHRLLEKTFGETLLGAWLHGSAATSGLRPHSDIDVLAVVGNVPSHAVRKRLVTEMMHLSVMPGAGNASRPVELLVFSRDNLAALPYPARAEFVFGEWLRAEFETGTVPGPEADPEYTLLLAQARNDALPLAGPALKEFVPAIPEISIRRAIADALPALVSSLEGDERNVLLTLARMWYTLATGKFAAKDDAARWAAPQLSTDSASILDEAREAYLSGQDRGWSGLNIENTAAELHKQVTALL
ncbi:aminoglycoside adenylyltransferase family protein [Mesorhizobium sp. CAU 1741]|uniref:aminoglycoside adenylyltransferase family protein n=1 Tax=Mesorhizobium sp. CAU 1741 TaxID=3140366 RepID=UPI00325A6F62